MKARMRWGVGIAGAALWLIGCVLLLTPDVGDSYIYVNISTMTLTIWLIVGLVLLAVLPAFVLTSGPTTEPQLMLQHLSDAVQIYDKRHRLVWSNERGRDFFSNIDTVELEKCIDTAASNEQVTMQMVDSTAGERVSISAVPLPDRRIVLVAKPGRKGQEDFYENFIHRIVHDMRNPLAGIVAHAANLAYVPAIPEDAAQSALTIEQEAQRLARLVDSLLFDARLAHIPLAPIQLELIDVVEDALFAHDATAHDRKVTIEVQSPSESLPLRGDHDLLVRAFSNIVDNAVKYGNEGGRVLIRITSSYEQYTVAFADDGEGIPEQYLPDRIFEPLTRARRRGSGSGLGLSIVKKIIQMHYGSVQAVRDGELGGTTITVNLPRKTRL